MESCEKALCKKRDSVSFITRADKLLSRNQIKKRSAVAVYEICRRKSSKESVFSGRFRAFSGWDRKSAWERAAHAESFLSLAGEGLRMGCTLVCPEEQALRRVVSRRRENPNAAPWFLAKHVNPDLSENVHFHPSL